MYTLSSPAEIMAQIVQFSYSDYYDGVHKTTLPYEVRWNVAFIIACFLAQHTVQGGDGVDPEIGYDGMQVDVHLSYGERVDLAKKLIEDFGGVKTNE